MHLFNGFIIFVIVVSPSQLRYRISGTICHLSPSSTVLFFFVCGQDESGATAEERQNNQNAGLEGEESRPESRPLLQETGMTKASPPLEDEDRGLGDSLPNTTSSSQTSLSAPPTAASPDNNPPNTPQQSPAAIRLPPADMVRFSHSQNICVLTTCATIAYVCVLCCRMILCSIDWCLYKVRFPIPAVGGGGSPSTKHF